ncbi:Crp/Fnr family transcriptional regulator [Asticcacaulis sp. YBE204]|uniref:Crp/Fnr family transcriptional regulator n=1 Tax=Asticcacaulis sp. YBE204 TaxID=1282363 RepID=UPI0003C4063E|nr:Crp/Fnr family transcriptional regulator [Asticcacaulis sp. YBE204]ESQ78412.1 hypothetical protein AEYBE204_14670 [Asticcacaulis sp. YBE204]
MSLSVAPMTAGSNLLMALQPGDRKLLQGYFELIEVTTGDVLFEAGDIVRYAWFPLGATLASFMVLLDDARGVETALIGREGAVGGIVSQGYLPAFSRAQVQFSGQMLRIDTADLERAKSASMTLRHFFARYSDCLLAQVFQAVACNATHTIEQRTARWLCSAIERTGDMVIPLTQDQLAGMLGVGRSYVGRVMGAMKRAGVLETVRSRIIVHSHSDVQRLSCGCNALVQAHFDEVLKGVYPDSSEHVAE